MKGRMAMELIFGLGFVCSAVAFQPVSSLLQPRSLSTEDSKTSLHVVDRRQFTNSLFGAASFATAGLFLPTESNAQVFFDPAQYGDQELRVAAVDSVKESVRRAILKDPALAPSFFKLSLLDGLSYDAKTQKYGPDGSILKTVFSTKAADEYTKNLQKAAYALIEAEERLRKKNAVSIADAIAIGGAEAIESIGGPILTVQIGRADTPKSGPVSPIQLDIFSGERSHSEVVNAFRSAGMTDREMTVLLAGLLTLETVEKSRTSDDWKNAARPKFREAGKMGRMSEFKPITEEDIAQAELEADPEYEDPDDGWYIADSFGSKETRFGDRIGKKDIDEKSFNKYIKDLNEAAKKKKSDLPEYGWIATLLLDPEYSTSQSWLNKYAGSNLSYLKDLNSSFNSMTQLGAVYTGGKYESLLKDRPRKSLNDDDLKLF